MVRNSLQLGATIFTALAMAANTILPLSAKASIPHQADTNELIAIDPMQPVLKYADSTTPIPRRQNCTQTEIEQHIHKLANDLIGNSSIPIPRHLIVCGTSTVPVLIAALKDNNYLVRSVALRVLGAMEPDAKAAAVPELIATLNDKDLHDEVIRSAFWAIDSATQDALPALIELLNHRDITVRVRAVNLLRRMGENARAAVPALITTFENESEDLNVRLNAAIALRDIANSPHLERPATQKFVSIWIERLQHQDVSVRAEAIKILGRMGAAAKTALPALIATFENESEELSVRTQAAEVLGGMGIEAKAAVPALIATFENNSKNLEVRLSAAEALRIIAYHTKLVAAVGMPPLIEALQDENDRIRASAIQVIVSIGPQSEDAVPALIESLTDSSASVRSTAAHALWGIGPKAEAAVPALIEAFKDPDKNVQYQAAKAIGGIAQDIEAVLPTLLEALKNEDVDVRASAIYALITIARDTTVALPGLVEALKDDNKDIRNAAIDALGEIGPKAKTAIPALTPLLKHNNVEVRAITAIALSQIGVDPQSIVPVLSQALQESEPFIRGRIVLALGDLGPAARAKSSALIDALKDRDSSVRNKAATALGNLGLDNQEVLQALMVALQDEDTYVRIAAALALGDIGIGAKSATPLLNKIFKDRDQDRDVRLSAALALQEIDPGIQVADRLLVENLQSGGSRDWWAVNILRELAVKPMSLDPETTVPALIAALKSENISIQRDAARVLGFIGTKAETAAPDLIRLLKDKDESLRIEAALALGQISPAAKVVVPTLVEFLKNSADGYRVAKVLGSIGLEAAPDLVETLEKKSKYARYGAAFALRQIGTSARSEKVVGGLLTIVNDVDGDLDVRWMAASALERIDPKVPVQHFFNDNNLISLNQIECSRNVLNYHDYTGSCELNGGEGWVPILDWIAKRRAKRR